MIEQGKELICTMILKQGTHGLSILLVHGHVLGDLNEIQ